MCEIINLWDCTKNTSDCKKNLDFFWSIFLKDEILGNQPKILGNHSNHFTKTIHQDHSPRQYNDIEKWVTYREMSHPNISKELIEEMSWNIQLNINNFTKTFPKTFPQIFQYIQLLEFQTTRNGFKQETNYEISHFVLYIKIIENGSTTCNKNILF